MIPKYALLVVDVQKDYCSSDGVLARTGIDTAEIGKNILPIKTLIEQAKSSRIPVIFIKTERGEKNSSENIWKLYKDKELQDLCLPSTEGVSLHVLDENLADKIFIKHRYNPFTNKELGAYLKEKEVNTLVLAGVFSDVCVDSAAREGFEKGYYIIALRDCLSSLGNKERDLEFYKKYYGAEILDSADFLEKINSK